MSGSGSTASVAGHPMSAALKSPLAYYSADHLFTKENTASPLALSKSLKIDPVDLDENRVIS